MYGAKRPGSLPAIAIGIAVATATARGQLLPPPGDGDIRTVYWELRGQSETWLTLELHDAAGSRAPLLTFTHRFPGKRPARPPTHVEVRAYAGRFWAPRVELWFLLDGEHKIDLAADGRAHSLTSGTPSDYFSETIPIETLKRIAGARRVIGRAIGFEFELTGAQQAAIEAFLARILSAAEAGEVP